MAVIRRESIQVTPRVAIPLDEIELRYSRSSGPGGQHAQKTETRVEAVFDVESSATLSEAQRKRLFARAGPVVRAVAQDERSQSRNRELALDRLAEEIRAGLRVERKRRPTKPTAAARERRLEEKKRRGQVKRLRQPPGAN
jgi:ribosome-associated protein